MTKSLYFFAASGYSQPAVIAARELGVELFVYDPTGAVSPVGGSKVPAGVSVPKWTPDQILWVGLVAFFSVAGILLLIRLLNW